LILAPPTSRQASRKAYTITAGLGWLGLPADKATVDIDEVSVQSELLEMGEETGLDTSPETDLVELATCSPPLTTTRLC